MIRLVPFLVLAFLISMWAILDIATPLPQASHLAGTRQANTAHDGPAVAPATAEVQGRSVRKPLALLVLDVSGSMKSDREFKERIAAEIFAFFFARLSERDVPRNERDRVHLALATFPGKSGGCMVHEWEGSPWLRVARSEASYRADAEAALGRVSEILDLHVGRPGKRNPRTGGDTPHDAAIRTADELVTRYRAEFGADADIYVVYFTDEPIDEGRKNAAKTGGLSAFDFRAIGQLNIGGSAYELVSKDPKVGLTYQLWQHQEPHEMIDHFLRGLRLEPADETAAFAAGIESSRVNQLLPIVIRAPGGFFKRSQPRLVTNLGSEIPLNNMGDTYYAVLDPQDAAIRNASSISLQGAANASLTAYRRPQWSMVVEPAVVGLLDVQEKAEVRVQFIGAERPKLVGPQVARLVDATGQFALEVPMSWDEARGIYSGWISDFRKLPRQGEYVTEWTDHEGTVLRHPLRVRRELDVRFVDVTNQKTVREKKSIHTLPRR